MTALLPPPSASPRPERSRYLDARALATRSLAGLAFFVLATTGQAQETVAADTPSTVVGPEVLVATINGAILPMTAAYLDEVITEAEARQAEAVILELSTPGGLVASTREMWTRMLGSPIPVVVWVAPSGSQAASAGFFLLMAGDIAAMSPGSNSGASHPVGPLSEDIPGVMGEKVEQDAAAAIRSLAARSGRDQKLAEAAVVESRSYTAEEALASGLVDLIVADLPSLLEEIDGRIVDKSPQGPKALRTADARTVRIAMRPYERLRAFLAQPALVFLFLAIGGIGIFFEISNPGTIFPGVIGAIFLLLGLYGLTVLPVNYVGLLLLVLAGVLFILELKFQTMGILTTAGLLSLIGGSLLLFKSSDPSLRLSLGFIVGVVVVTGAVIVSLMLLAVRAQNLGVRTGSEGMVTARGTARSALAPMGKVNIRGEIWDAVADEPVAPGAAIEVVAVEGMTLRVRGLSAG